MLVSLPFPSKSEMCFHLETQMIFRVDSIGDREVDFGFKPPSSEKLLWFWIQTALLNYHTYWTADRPANSFLPEETSCQLRFGWGKTDKIYTSFSAYCLWDLHRCWHSWRETLHSYCLKSECNQRLDVPASYHKKSYTNNLRML